MSSEFKQAGWTVFLSSLSRGVSMRFLRFTPKSAPADFYVTETTRPGVLGVARAIVPYVDSSLFHPDALGQSLVFP